MPNSLPKWQNQVCLSLKLGLFPPPQFRMWARVKLVGNKNLCRSGQGKEIFRGWSGGRVSQRRKGLGLGVDPGEREKNPCKPSCAGVAILVSEGEGRFWREMGRAGS